MNHQNSSEQTEGEQEGWERAQKGRMEKRRGKEGWRGNEEERRRWWAYREHTPLPAEDRIKPGRREGAEEEVEDAA